MRLKDSVPNHKRNRRSIRLQSFDYGSAGAYFITICCYEKQHLFGEVLEDKIRLNEMGLIVGEEWQRSEEIRAEMTMDAFVIMPNHIHGIVFIQSERVKKLRIGGNVSDESSPTTTFIANVGAHGRAPLHGDTANDSMHRKPKSLSSFVAGFKSVCTKRINLLRNTPRLSVWQRNYYEYVIRNEADLDRIRSYIRTNPKRWTNDKYHPNFIREA